MIVGECTPIFHWRCVFTYYNIMINWHDYGWMQLEIIKCSFSFHNMASIMLWIFLIDCMIFKSSIVDIVYYYCIMGFFFGCLDPCLICLLHIIFFPTNQGWVWKNLTQIHFSRTMVAFICLMHFMFYENKINWSQSICKKMFTIYFFVFLLVNFEDHNASKSHHTCTNEASSAPLPHTKKNFSFTHPQTNVHGQSFGNIPLLEQSNTRIFVGKLQHLLDELLKKGIFGEVVANIHVIEW